MQSYLVVLLFVAVAVIGVRTQSEAGKNIDKRGIYLSGYGVGDIGVGLGGSEFVEAGQYSKAGFGYGGRGSDFRSGKSYDGATPTLHGMPQIVIVSVPQINGAGKSSYGYGGGHAAGQRYTQVSFAPATHFEGGLSSYRGSAGRAQATAKTLENKW